MCFAMALVTVTLLTLQQEKSDVSLLMENVEALAQEESGGDVLCVGQGTKHCPYNDGEVIGGEAGAN
ncbi:MAG: NVEALA domain-containing protein [Bacteroidales bacterium]